MRRLLDTLIYWFKGLFTVRAYVACKMTGRNRREMIKRAKRMCSILRKAGVEPISPVIEERVQARPGKLKNPSKLRLFKKWTDDKHIITWLAHAVILDGAEQKSFGMEREYGLNRFWLWKPTLLRMPDQGITVAVFEDDLISDDEEALAHYLVQKHGSLYRRWKWRLALFNRCLPKFLAAQLWQWVH